MTIAVFQVRLFTARYVLTVRCGSVRLYRTANRVASHRTAPHRTAL